MCIGIRITVYATRKNVYKITLFCKTLSKKASKKRLSNGKGDRFGLLAKFAFLLSKLSSHYLHVSIFSGTRKYSPAPGLQPEHITASCISTFTLALSLQPIVRIALRTHIGGPVINY